MRVLIHSDLPMTNSGYASQIKHIEQWLRDEGHDIAFKTPQESPPVRSLDGAPVYPSDDFDTFGWPTMARDYEHFNADFVFSLSDHWHRSKDITKFLNEGHNGVFYTVVDTETPRHTAPPDLGILSHGNAVPVAMTRWAQERLLRLTGIQEVHRVPHMIDLDEFYPNQVSKRRTFGVESEVFVVSFIGRNDRRKNIPGMVHAFAEFVQKDEVDQAVMYIHTDMLHELNLYDVIESMPVHPREILTPDRDRYANGEFDTTDLRNVYNASDVYLHTTGGESWGMTVTEAMACDTPVVASDNSSVTEQLTDDHQDHVSTDSSNHVNREEGYVHDDHGTLVWSDFPIWRPTMGTMYTFNFPRDVADALLEHYRAWKAGDSLIKPTHDYVRRQYGADTVLEEHWRPFFDSLPQLLDFE